KDPLRRARLRPVEVELALEAGLLTEARAAQVDLEEIGRDYESPAIKALAKHARGAIALAEGRAVEASNDLRSSFSALLALEMPYEAARARIDLARALAAGGAKELGLIELEAAEATLRKLGAHGMADGLAGEKQRLSQP